MSSDNYLERENEFFNHKKCHVTTEEHHQPVKDYIFKIVVAGDGGVGKTSLLNQYISSTFMDIMRMTIGTTIFSKVIQRKDSVVTLQLWDFGGEKRFRFLLPDYCRGACGIILVFDLNDFTTLMNLHEWLQIVNENTKDPIIILVGNKVDLIRSIDEDFIREFCKKNRIEKFIPTSAKTGKNVEHVFGELVKYLLSSSKDQSNTLL